MVHWKVFGGGMALVGHAHVDEGIRSRLADLRANEAARPAVGPTRGGWRRAGAPWSGRSSDRRRPHAVRRRKRHRCSLGAAGARPRGRVLEKPVVGYLVGSEEATLTLRRTDGQTLNLPRGPSPGLSAASVRAGRRAAHGSVRSSVPRDHQPLLRPNGRKQSWTRPEPFRHDGSV